MSFTGEYNVLELSSFQKWNDSLERLPIEQQDVYYTPEYYRLYENLGDGKAKCFVYEEGENIALYPFLINSVNELGYKLDKDYYDIQGAYGYNGICCDSNDPAFLNGFYKSFNQYCIKSNIIAEFIRFHPMLQNEELSSGHMSIIQERETIMIDLQKPHKVLWEEDYSSKNRNMIRKAQKLGYKIQSINYPNKRDIETFLCIYNNSMDAVIAEKYYYFNSDFFFNTFNFLKEHAILLNVLDKVDEVVCSSIFFHFGDYFHYHLSGRRAKSDNSINNFLIDNAVTYAQERGAKYFHLGGGRTSSKDDSLFKFKKVFSKKALPFYVGKKLHFEKVYFEVVKQWSKMYPWKLVKYHNFLLKYRY